MRVLFVSSGNSKSGITATVQSQGESLKKNGIELDYFAIQRKGAKGYIQSIARLRKFIKKKNYNLIHAHYFLSAIVASLSSKLPMVVSLMGSDTHMNLFWKRIIKLFYRFRWNVTIVKSARMKTGISLDDAFVIPNGLDFHLFKPIERSVAKIKVGFNDNRHHIVFIANPERPEKKYSLAKKAIELIKNDHVELNTVSNVVQKIIPYYINSADVLLLTSSREGSPNVVKEAMACNCPIVSTDVGDVKEVIGNTEGCYICSYKPEDVANKIKLALDFGKRTDGRKNIKHLDENIIAKKIIDLYKKVLGNNIKMSTFQHQVSIMKKENKNSKDKENSII